jgi:hypothetical protein
LQLHQSCPPYFPRPLLWTHERGLGEDFAPEVRSACANVYDVPAAIMQAGAADVADLRTGKRKRWVTAAAELPSAGGRGRTVECALVHTNGALQCTTFVQ